VREQNVKKKRIEARRGTRRATTTDVMGDGDDAGEGWRKKRDREEIRTKDGDMILSTNSARGIPARAIVVNILLGR